MDIKIALVEDDPLISKTLQINLKGEGYLIDTFPSGELFLKANEKKTYHLLILDLMLPGKSGLQVLEEIREKDQTAPVLFLTVESDVQTKVKAFMLGADDYLTKPFNLEELLGRVKAIIRRVYSPPASRKQHTVIINDFKINIETRTCESNLGEITLSEKETKFLLYLVDHAGEILRRADILEEVWGMDVFPTPRTVDNFILKYRKLFEDNPKHPKIFISIRDQGYSFHP